MAGEMVSIKGTREGLVILLDPSREFEDIKQYLQRKMDSSRGFFKGARFTVYQGHTAISVRQRQELENICRQYGLIPSPEVHWPPRRAKSAAPPLRPAAAGTGEPAGLIRRTLRSGQEINCRNHVIVAGDVHPGAVVNAGGNIIIMGVCAGSVHAGTDGNTRARIAALRLTPVRLAIAGVETPGDALPSGDGPQTASLSGRRIILTPLFPGQEACRQ
ncbi:septum site-determining protein MinC [Desulfotomaculum copahuensis]|uniref:Probable septum site-determining protein MinC n=1 Tax=Desulfotomaculum copahuensis TaxID=1838280 RepID=A0A1B7LEM1_9FIRM|nr:septum site-determining protein MinC [Desulfotomaculum copahuensis]OAT81740.1 hypothetical protein A6M21_10060 [Desulfotomaculum copahuensis]